MTDDELYLRTIDDLESKLHSKDHYSLIRAAALIRQLFLDERPLAHVANREPKLKLVFREFQVPPLPDFMRWGVAWDSADDRPFPSGNFVKLDNFLSSSCFAVGAHTYSVA